MITIVVGLGNPGKKFENTRHNLGFMVVDFFAKKNEFPDFELSKKYESLICENERAILVKPQTFMNESGKAVVKLTTHYKLPTTNLVIVHDDIDLPLGKIKIVKDSGAGGHRGVESIINNVGTKDFIRLKIGICPEKKSTDTEKFVIQKFTKEKMGIVNESIKKSAEVLKILISDGIEKAMNAFN